MALQFITVSIDIMHHQPFNQSQKFIYAEIQQLSSLEAGCFAKNEHFANLIGITKENVSKNISWLTKEGYISVEIVNGSRNHKRIIELTDKLDSLIKVVSPPYQSSKPPLPKRQETKENIQSKKQSNNIVDLSEKPTSDVRVVFNYWVGVMDKGDRVTLTDGRRAKIKARLKKYPLKDVLLAVLNVSKSDYHMEHGYNDLELICRSDTNLEKYRDLKPPPERKSQRDAIDDDDMAWLDQLRNGEAHLK